jgi:hypothetical protein
MSALELHALRELRSGVRWAGLPRQSPALTPGQRRAQRAALIQVRLNSAMSTSGRLGCAHEP